LPATELAAALEAERLLLLGDVAWSLNELPRAISYYLSSIAEASRGDISYEEFLCRLPLVSIYAFAGDFQEAEQHLVRAQGLISDKTDRLAYRFREILLNRWRKQYSPAHALSELGTVAQQFNDMGLLQEMGWVRLHCADVQREMGQDFRQTLDDLQALSVVLQNHAFLAREWSILPQLRREAQRSHPHLAGTFQAILELHTLATEQILLAGEPVRIPLKKAPEVLAYFLEHKAVSLDRLLRDVFPDEKPRSAKSYFHQVRHQLKEHVEGLEIEFDRETRLYRLKSEVDILWDVAELRAGRQVAETGPFLPGSGNDWALMLDHSLERFRDAPV
jgi:tetratricopeptide (TPR) repeat protein